MIVTLDSKRRVSLPASLAPAKPGDQFDATFDADDDVVILRRVPRKKDWLKVLEECPVPMNDLPRRSRDYPKIRNICSNKPASECLRKTATSPRRRGGTT